MVSINLVPESVIKARSARQRFRLAAILLGILALASASVVSGREIILWVCGEDRGAVRLVKADIELLREELLQKQRELERQEATLERRKAEYAAKLAVIRQLAAVSERIPQRVTLSSLYINEHNVIISGVAGDRSHVGALVDNLKADIGEPVVSIQKLEPIIINKHSLQDFVIKRSVLTNASRPNKQRIEHDEHHG